MKIVIVTSAMLTDQLHEYSDPAGKIKRMKDAGEVFQLTRGVYETNPDTPGYCLAGAIFGPSYLSFDYALARHGLIPETVYTFTSATFFKSRSPFFKPCAP